MGKILGPRLLLQPDEFPALFPPTGHRFDHLTEGPALFQEQWIARSIGMRENPP
jgi:hypothetical protein